jgi:hypothetical protein
VTGALKQRPGVFHRFATCLRQDHGMNIRVPSPLALIALSAAVLRGLAEFVSLQGWRLRERWTR